MSGFNSLISRGLTFVNTIRVKFHICAGEEESSKLYRKKVILSTLWKCDAIKIRVVSVKV